jgi:nitrite reductase/ring-hydroxylating ferredoxin subunit
VDAQEIKTLRALMEYEARRTAPPAAFPSLPDLPGGRYTDPAFMALEKDYIWRKSWLLAAHIDEVPEPGCFLLWENAGQPVVIVHSESGGVNAFYNTCSHRGAPVVTETKGKKLRLTCRYHGWTYNHEGELLSIRDPEDFKDLDFSCRSLNKVRCRCSTGWGRLPMNGQNSDLINAGSRPDTVSPSTAIGRLQWKPIPRFITLRAFMRQRLRRSSMIAATSTPSTPMATIEWWRRARKAR